MKRRTFFAGVGAAAASGLLPTSATVAAANESLPREGNQFMYHTHEQVIEELDQLEAASQVPFEIIDIGETVQGRSIQAAAIGSGDTDVLITTEQHGDEPTGTIAAFELMGRYVVGDGGRLGTRGGVHVPTDEEVNIDVAQMLEDDVTVHVVPMQNRDGGMHNQRRNVRDDDFEWEDPWFGEQSGDVDPNRQHYFGLPPGVLPDGDYPDENPAPSSQALIDYGTNLDNLEWFMDLHTQGIYGESDDTVLEHTGSTFWPINEFAGDDAVDLAIQMNKANYDAVTAAHPYSVMSEYPGGNTNNISRNAWGVRGYGSMLYEVDGQISHRGQRVENLYANEMVIGVDAIIKETADGSLYDRNPDDVDLDDRPGTTNPPWGSGTE